MKIFFTILFLTLTLSIAAEELVTVTKKTIKMPQKWAKLNQLVDKEILAIENGGKLDAGLKYRLLVLYSEKMALIRELEDKIYLSTPPEITKKKEKNEFYKKTIDYYKKTLSYGQQVVKDHPQFPDLSHVLNTLAENSLHFSNDKNNEKFLLLALNNIRSNTKGRDDLIFKVKTSLAEHYYNEKNYPLAIQYYEDVLKRKNDPWYTKHLYNSGWCYFKDKKYKQAIENLKQAHFVFKSDNKLFISVSDQVMNSIGLFFVYNHQAKEAIKFYLEESPDPVRDLMKLANAAAEQGQFTDLVETLHRAYTTAEQRKNHEEKVLIRMKELDFYRQFKRDDLYFSSALSLNELNKEKEISEENREEIVNKIKEVVGVLQIKLTKDAKKNEMIFKKEELSRAIEYFEILCGVDSRNSDQYRFYQGETYFSVGQYLNAAEAYKKSILAHKILNINQETELKLKEEKLALRTKIMNSLLGTISKESFDRNTEKVKKVELTLFAYSNYIQYWPNDEKAKIIYPKLFTLNMERTHIDDAITSNEEFHKYFPDMLKDQQAQFKIVLDYYIKRKDAKTLAEWINKLNKEYLKFSADEIEKATAILGSILFEEIQKLEKNGDKKDAITKSIDLFNSLQYPAKIRSNAAYNASILLLEEGEIEKSFQWQILSLSLKNKEEEMSEIPRLYILIQEYSLKQDFEHSGKLSSYILSKFCKDKFKEKNEIFKQFISSELLSSNTNKKTQRYEEVEKQFNNFTSCIQEREILTSIQENIINFYYKNRDLNGLDYFSSKWSQQVSKVPFKDIYEEWYWYIKHSTLSTSNRSEEEQIVINNLKKFNHNFYQEILQLKEFKMITNDFLTTTLYPSQKSLENKEFVFSPDDFSTDLENKIQDLQKITEKAKILLTKFSVESNHQIYWHLGLVYNHLGFLLKEYQPQRMPAEMIPSFKSQISEIANGMNKQATSYLHKGKDITEKYILNSKYINLYNMALENGVEQKLQYLDGGIHDI